ncbi:polyhomeotic-proximal chromatin protein [Drosophila sechellia]|uniref:polyhomeotic-proximal chromatin protein n=1 Tax=Drosophila sechellia TaxID=7238 RepID=UPI0013DE1158|nr:polyhomeotic-proximal chromatin protein [Drosophila sechellia]
MDRRALKFMQKRADTESDTTTPVSTTASQGIPASAILAGSTLPLKDNSNIREKPLHHNYNHNNNNSSQHTHSHQQQQQQQVGGKQLERPLKCLETLAQKAGITFDEKYDVASPPHPGIAQQQATSGTGPATGSGSVTPTSHRHGTPPTGRRQTHTPSTPNRPSAPSTPNTNCNSIARHTSLTLEKAQNPGQQVAASTTVPLQISPEQLQQFYASNPYAIQVKQEFPTHTTSGSGTELKHATNIMEVQQQLQLQQQLSEASGGGAASAGAGGAASPANSQQSQQQQHSTAISTMSPMQLAAATGGVGGDWTQGRTVQLMQPSTSFLYPQMIVSGNLLHPGGLGQQPIQVITAGKPFQGNGPQMLTTTTQNAKQMIGGQAGFAGGNYATCIPTNHNQSPQTVLFSPMNVISPQQQQNLLQSMAAAAQQQQLTQQQQQFNQQQQQQLTQQQQQLTAALAKVGVDAQGKLAQKVVQKVTTTSKPGGVVRGQPRVSTTAPSCSGTASAARTANTQTQPNGRIHKQQTRRNNNQAVGGQASATASREQQQQVAQAQAQHQQALANATQQILQVAPNQFITSHQQQQQQQLHNQLIQQQLQQQAQAQVQAQVQAQAQQQQQQREQQQNIIQQIVVQQSAGATSQQQQQQQHQQSGQLQLSSVPFSVSSSTTPAGIATSSALQAALSASGAIFQTAKPGTCSSSSPTSSVVTITNQSSTPLVTSSTVTNLQQAQSQSAQVHQHQQLISATIAGGTQQQPQGPPLLTPTTNPILAMTSMMNATVGHLSTAPPVTVSVTSTAVTSSPGQLVLLSTASSGGGGSIPATPTKETPSKGPTATLVPIGSPKTPVSAKDTCTTPKSSTPATVSASVEASSSTSEALSNGDASDRSSTPSKGATTPTSKQSNAVQPPSSTTPSSVSGKEEPKLATSGSLTSATSTSTTTTITNGIGVARTTASTTAVSTASTTTTSSGTFTTSCTSTTTTTTSGISNGSKDLPKAMIKPNVLTHVIDGFIIQEANEPFPVTRQRYADKDVSDEPPKKKATMQEDIKLSGIASAPGSDMVACEQCGKMEHKAKLKRKRYCSPGCSRQAKNGIGGVGSGETNGLETGGIVGVDAMALVDRLDEAMAEEKMQTEATPKLSESFPILGASTEVPPMSLPVQAAISASSPLAMPLGSPLSVALPTLAPLSVVTSGATPKSSEVNGTDRPPISSWSVDDVSNFIRELPGCQDYVDDFIQQEIDGQALLLLKEKHLVNAMGMKLGPALKIVAKVESIKEVPPPGEAKDPGAQ